MFILHPLMDTLGCFHLSPAVTHAAMDMSVQTSFQDSGSLLLGIIPRNGIAGSYTLFLREESSLGVEMTHTE